MALVSLKYKIVFIHFPRTGGTTIRNLFGKDSALRVIGGAHCTQARFEKEAEESPHTQIKSFRKFGIIRNPETYILSLYRYISQNGNHPEYEQVRSLSLLEFIDWYSHKPICRERGAEDNRYLTQSEFYGDIELFMYENYERNIDILLKRLGIVKPIPHVNKSTSSIQHTKQTRQKVREVFDEDFRRWY